ncbi:tRNA-His guanylyltransferase, partial [Ceratobasidium sp. 392]
QQGGMTAREAETKLKGTLAKDKHEILFRDFKINYNALPERFKKGSVLVREVVDPAPDAITISAQNTDQTGAETSVTDETGTQDSITVSTKPKRNSKKKQRAPPTVIRIVHVDIIKDDFWSAHSDILD